MIYSYEKLYSTAQLYCRENNLQLEQKLGHGTQGIVYSTNRNSALKIHAEQPAYKRERDVYLRLAEHRAHKINALIIPQLLKYDDSFLALEMTLVAPPFMVDFGGAYLDRPPAHMLDPQVVGEWLEEKKEQFGTNWTEVHSILAQFESKFDIFISDVNPGNIIFKQ